MRTFEDVNIGDYVFYGRIDPPVIINPTIKGKVEHYAFTDFYFENPYSKKVIETYNPNDYDEFSVDDLKQNSVTTIYDGIFLNYEDAFNFVDKGMHEFYENKKADLENYIELMNKFKRGKL